MIGESGQNVRILTSMIQKRFGYAPGSIEVVCNNVAEKGLSAAVQAESLRLNILNNLPVRMACMSVIRFSMRCGATGVEVRVGGKIRAMRAKSIT